MATQPSSSVRVGLRVRPLLSNERHQSIAVQPMDDTSLEFSRSQQTFTYDYVFGMDISQQELYNQTAAPLLKSFMEGYNITLIAYGQTGSGKTFTMGSSDEVATGDSEGLIPRFLVDLFENLQASSDEDNDRLQSWKVKASFLEIYGEDVYDLTTTAVPACAPAGMPASIAAMLPSDRPSLPVREDETGRVFVQGLHEIEVSTTQEAVGILSQGSKNRITGATAMNAGSSRSHAVYTIQLEQTLQSSTSADDRHQMQSKLTFVDLAGSERLKRTGAEGQRLKEGIQINSGLFNLGQVINALADDQRIKSGNKVGFVPYRNSKLTHFLKDALGGNSQTLFLACVSPAESNESETLSTLNYARQARNIQNKPIVNMDKTQLELRQLKYAVKAWMMKAIGQKFGGGFHVPVPFSLEDPAPTTSAAAGQGQGPAGLMSPLPCVSPVPAAQNARSASKAGSRGFDDELALLLGRSEVQEYISAVNAAIGEKLAGGYLPSPRKVRLSALPGASPFRVGGGGTKRSATGLQGVAKKLCSSLSGASGENWDDQPVGGAGHKPAAGATGAGTGAAKGMPSIREEAEDGAAAGEDANGTSVGWLRAAAGATLDSADPEETERLVTRMLEMINKEKAAFEGGDGDGEAGAGVDTVATAQQEKAIVEMDRAIAEKEEILTKLLDTVRGYAAMKSDFERLLDSIGTLETERQQLEVELEKSKLQAHQAASGSGSGSGTPGVPSAGAERIKERFLKVKEELRVMREERKNKENAYRLMQRESKQCDALQKELAKLKESKVSAQRQQRQQAAEMQKLKKDQQLKLTSLKKSDVKKQQLMNTLKSELVKRDRVLGHKDREIGRINSKLKACEEHISQLLKMQTRQRAKGATATTAAQATSASSLTAAEQEHLQSSKAMLDNLVGERVERRRNQVLFERKGAKLRELNADLAQETHELEALSGRRKELLRAEGRGEESEDQEDGDEDFGDDDQRAERAAVQQQMRQVESNVDRITRELDLLNTDIEDLAASLGGANGAGADASAEGGSQSLSWEDLGKEVISGLSLPQCNVLLWQQIGEKAALQEEVRLTGLHLLGAREEVEAANGRADSYASQLNALRTDMQRKLMDAEKQRVQDVWALLKAQQQQGGETNADVAPTCDRVAMQRAQELESELEMCLANEEKARADNKALQAQLASLEASALKASHMSALVKQGGGDDSSAAEDSATRAFFEQLSTLWDVLGVTASDRTVTVSDIREAEITARARALQRAERNVAACESKEQRLRLSLRALCEALGQAPSSFMPAAAIAAADSDVDGQDADEDDDGTMLRHLPLFGRCATLQSAADAATAVMTVRSSGLEAIKEQLLNTMSEMWLDAGQLPDCLKRVMQVDFHSASVQAGATSRGDEQAHALDVTGDEGDRCEASDDLGAGADLAIASFMIHSAVAVADQLKRCGLRLREEDVKRWERELRALNVTRASLTTQLVAARTQAVQLCESLDIIDAFALEEVQCRSQEGADAAADGSSNGSNGNGIQEQAERAAIELVVVNSASNPPGSEPLLVAVRGLIRDLEAARATREGVERSAKQLAALFQEAIATKDDDGDLLAAPQPAGQGLRHLVEYLRGMPAATADTRAALVARLGRLLEHVIATAGTGSSGADGSKDVEAKIAAVLETATASAPSARLSAMEGLLQQMAAATMSAKEAWLCGGVQAIDASWKVPKESHIPSSKSRAGTAPAPEPAKPAVKDALRQIAALSAEVARLTIVADTFRDLQKLDGQLVRHVREMEDFEAASKQDRMKLLSGNSRALIEEEKFRKTGKRKYEQITERIIALAEQLDQLTAGACESSAASPAGTCVDIGPLDLSSLSAQSHAVLKGKIHWQEKLELMHLHTTTHGTRRWSGGLPNGNAAVAALPAPPAREAAAATSANVFSAAISRPPAAPAGPAAGKASRPAPAPASSASAAVQNPFAAATAAGAATGMGPAMRPKDAVTNCNTAANSRVAAAAAAPAAASKAKPTSAVAVAAATAAKKAVSFSKENVDGNVA